MSPPDEHPSGGRHFQSLAKMSNSLDVGGMCESAQSGRPPMVHSRSVVAIALFVIAVGYFALPKTEDLDPTLDLQFPGPRSENLCYVGASI